MSTRREKLKKFFKLNNWKRWFILFLVFITAGLFIGLSFGLKSKDTKPSSDYSNGITLVVKPTDQSGNEINDQMYLRQMLFNFKKMLEGNFKDSVISTSIEEPGTWKIDITNVKNKDDLKRVIDNPTKLKVAPINYQPGDTVFVDVDKNNPFFNAIVHDSSSNRIQFILENSLSNEFFKNVKNNAGNSEKNDQVIIWKNYDILLKLYEQEKNTDPNFDQKYNSIYEFLFLEGLSPEEKYDGGDNDTTRPPIFKEEFIYEGKKYKATDFIFSKNNLPEYSFATPIKAMTIYQGYDVTNGNVTDMENLNDFYQINYTLSSYELNDYILSPFIANNGNNAQFHLLIAFSVIMAALSIFVVINYGYLGIFAILLAAIVIFLSLLMISVFIRDYDSSSVCAVIASALIMFDFIVLFFERVKKQFLKGNTISKSIKNTIKNEKKTYILKAFLLTLTFGAFYGVISLVYGSFSFIVLISIIVSSFISIPAIIGISRLMTNIKSFKSNPRLIGFWRKKYRNVNLHEKQKTIKEQLSIDETIQLKSSSNDKLIKKSHKRRLLRYSIFQGRLNNHGLMIVLSTISYILIFGLVIYLFSFFINGRTFLSGFHNILPEDQNKIVLRISKSNNDKFSNDEISSIEKLLIENKINIENVKNNDNYEIQATIDKDFSDKTLNELSLKLNNLYSVVVLTTSLTNSDTFKIMRYTLFAILIAIITMCVFVLFWMKWSKALSLLIVSIASILSFIGMVAFGLIQINPMLSIAAGLMLLIFTSLSINIISKIHYKLKTKRIEELTTENIRDVVYKQVFKMLRPILIFSSSVALMFVVFAILYSSLPFLFSVFIIGYTIVNFIYVSFLLPRVIIWIESKRANIKRNAIINNFWDTEKIKEQTFKGINNIK